MDLCIAVVGILFVLNAYECVCVCVCVCVCAHPKDYALGFVCT